MKKLTSHELITLQLLVTLEKHDLEQEPDWDLWDDYYQMLLSIQLKLEMMQKES